MNHRLIRGSIAAAVLFAAIAACSDDPSGGGAPPGAASSGGAGTPGAAGTGGGGAGAAGPAAPIDDTKMPSAAQLRAWQESIDGFDKGYRPTGSPAHEGYIKRLLADLGALGVSDLHTEPYAFVKWTPKSWAFSLVGGKAPGPVSVTGYVPYSGTTGPLGIAAPLVYVPTAILTQAVTDPSALGETIAANLKAAIGAMGGVFGRIVVFDVQPLTLPMSMFTGGDPLYTNDPTGTLVPSAKVSQLHLATMLQMPVILNVLAASGAVGAIGILDAPEPIARAAYAPFFGTTTPNVPALYVDRETGKTLKDALASAGPFIAAKLRLDATLAPTISTNIVAKIPGASKKEIILSSHTDGPNSMEDNGPVGILALASYFSKFPQAERPCTLRLVLTGGHFVGSLGINTYVTTHAVDLLRDGLAVMELEHLGAREWAEVSPGKMGLTGRVEPQFLYTSKSERLVAESIAFAKQFPRSVVAGSMPFGEGQHFRGLPLMQFITMPSYLLSGYVPEITTQLTDYDAMRKQIIAFARMELALANAPEGELGPGSLF